MIIINIDAWGAHINNADCMLCALTMKTSTSNKEITIKKYILIFGSEGTYTLIVKKTVNIPACASLVKLEIWGKAQRESTQRCKSDRGEISRW